MQVTKSQTNFNDDGFQSDDQPRTDLINMPTEEPREKTIALEEHMIKYIPPPQDIVEKSYSLHPDIITGWAPKISLPKPIPLTFPFQLLSRMLKAYDKIDTSQVQLKFLGPRFDSTYSSWKLLSNQFPYTHLAERKVLITDRKNEQRKVINHSWQVKFDSLFESGNLDAVFQVGEYEYDCFMRVDTNTKGHLQWFYFRMSNLRAQVKYKINICNFQKSKTLYLRGMKPYIYSAFQFINTGIGWHQRGQNVEYAKRIPKSIKTILHQNDEFESKYYTLSFTISTQIQRETLELAYCPPYTYSKLVSFLKDLSKNNKSRNIIVEDQLCLSLGGFKIPFLTITSQASQAQSQFKNNCAVKEKSLIFLTGRIHPGECNGSYMMQGFLSWICGSTAQAQQLRNKYIFKVVPMVNPDGVIMGNYRTGLSGKDFNREFTQPDPTWFVQISQLKNEIQKCQWIYQKRFNFFLDFHGHTVKKNIFAYGPQFPLIHSKYYECRLFPKLLSQKTELFRYYSCMFKVAASKVATARAILLREYGIPFTYTIQASNGCFYDQQSKKDVAFDINKWLIVGSKIGQALFEYMKILNKIQEESLNRKKNREERQKNKMEKTKRIQSSVDKRHHKSLVSNKQKIAVRIQEKSKNKLNQNFYNNILKEITIDKQIENKKCSDDQLSQGKSDSQNSDDDLQDTALKNLLLGVKKPTKKIHILKNLQQKKAKEENIMKIIQKSSFITDIQSLPLQNEKDRYSPIEKRKRQSNCRRKIYTVNSIPSPTRDQDMSNPKIINISFIINPVPISNSYVGLPERRIRQKTDNYEFQNENKQTIKQQTSDSFRRTYLSLQRETLKKEMLKKISVFGKSFSTSKDNFKMQEVVGKRIFNEN